jgi:hypothetical protein
VLGEPRLTLRIEDEEDEEDIDDEEGLYDDYPGKQILFSHMYMAIDLISCTSRNGI